MFEQNYRRLKRFIWLWGTTCWKSACIIAHTRVQLTNHWRCLFITACYCMSKLFWRCHSLTGAAELWVCLLWEYCCFALCFWVLCAGMRCKARTALDCLGQHFCALCTAGTQPAQSGAEVGVWKWVSKSRQCCCGSAVEEVGLMREWEIPPTPLWGQAVSLKDQLCPPAWWPRHYSRLCKSFAKLGITFGLVLVIAGFAVVKTWVIGWLLLYVFQTYS